MERKFYFYNMDTNEWIVMPEMPFARANHLCGVTNNNLIVAIGTAYNDTVNSTYSPTEVHVFSPRNGMWQAGPDLSEWMEGSVLVQLGSKVLIVGGLAMVENREKALESILLFDPDPFQKGQWIKLDQALSKGRFYHAALAVPRSFGTCV